MKNVALVFRDRNKKFQEKIVKRLNKKFPSLNLKFFWKNRLSKTDFEKVNLVISIGGDGTFLSASHLVKNQLILGVNHDEKKSEGALTKINLSSLEKKLLEVLDGKFKIKEYTRVNAKIIKKDKCILAADALNEVYVGNVNPHHTSRYTLRYKNKIENQTSSGILISSGTGSSAWYKTMGGQLFSKTKKEIRFIVREPYSRRIHKTKITKGKIKKDENLEITSLTSHKILAIDSIKTYKIKKGDKIIISLGRPLRVIQ